MWKTIVIICCCYAVIIKLATPFQLSLMDYKACQERSNCSKNLQQSDCPRGSFLDPHMSESGCCHGCRKGIDRNKSGCSRTKSCAPGLECNENFYCTLNRTSCLHTMHYGAGVVGWKPNCEKDGSFSAKQCRGDKITGRCFCYAETGEKIFGSSWWRDADQMTCACSRQRFKAEKSGRADVTLRCQENGNYERLQCDAEICWCADETGYIEEDSFAVPESLWTFLPCYNASEHGDQYLRKCESASHAQKMVQKKLINRGAISAVPNQIQCSYDGSYAEIVIENPLAFCQMPDGSKLNYATPSKLMSDMNCNCARDEKIYQHVGRPFNLRCRDNGNYEPMQDQNGKIFCVDRDGFAVSGLLSSNSINCDMFYYYAYS